MHLPKYVVPCEKKGHTVKNISQVTCYPLMSDVWLVLTDLFEGVTIFDKTIFAKKESHTNPNLSDDMLSSYGVNRKLVRGQEKTAGGLKVWMIQ